MNRVFICTLVLLIFCSCGDRSRRDRAKGNQPFAAKGKEYEGKAVKILDGDTFDLYLKDTVVRVRLSAIDCPEKGQPFGKNAKQQLAELIGAKQVKVKLLSFDRNKRWICDVYRGKENINHTMIVQGFAWHYLKYSDDPHLNRLENRARKKRVGLWSDDKAVPPWEWRKQKK